MIPQKKKNSSIKEKKSHFSTCYKATKKNNNNNKLSKVYAASKSRNKPLRCRKQRRYIGKERNNWFVPARLLLHLQP